jgi:S-adenosylmethionine hydrolase
MSSGLITLTTDFGDKSGYVGIMKGVIYNLFPGATVVDISHMVTPQNIQEGAYLLSSAYRYFQAGAVHVAVVDPGVGTARRAIGLKVPEIGYFVGPDNGLFAFLIENYPNLSAREITNPAFMRHPVSATFHGRDIFAPTAALLARGEPFEELGPLLRPDDLVGLEDVQPRQKQKSAKELDLKGQVIHVDHFGNLITNIRRETFEGLSQEQLAKVNVEVGMFYRIKGIIQTYGQARPKQVVALFGSSGYLEIARVNGRATDYSGTNDYIKIGQSVKVKINY